MAHKIKQKKTQIVKIKNYLAILIIKVKWDGTWKIVHVYSCNEICDVCKKENKQSNCICIDSLKLTIYRRVQILKDVVTMNDDDDTVKQNDTHANKVYDKNERFCADGKLNEIQFIL